MKQCSRCRETKPETAFHREAKQPDGLGSYCRPCANEYRRVRRSEILATDPDRLRKREAATRERLRAEWASGARVLPETAVCRDCGATKPVAEFHPATGTHRGISPRCIPCNSRKSTEWSRKNPKTTSEYSRKRRFKIHFGITVEEYDEMLAAQGGVCAICSRSPGARRLAVDHCHTTGVVRGLLCDLCNWTLGLMDDDPKRLQRVITYVSSPVYPFPVREWDDGHVTPPPPQTKHSKATGAKRGRKPAAETA